MVPGGFAVYEGSRGRTAHAPSLVGTSHERMRSELLASGVLVVEDDEVVFQRDHSFRSPSAAATVILGRASNGWLEWMTVDGRTLDEVKRR